MTVKNKRLRLCGAVAAFLLLTNVHPVLADAPSDAREIFDDAKKRVYQIRSLTAVGDAQNSSGSGFLVGENGLIATNWHVVADAIMEPGSYRLEALRTDNTRIPVTVVAIDSTNDLALLQAKEEKGIPFRIRETPLEKGERSYSIGNPMNVGFTVVEGTFNGIEAHSLRRNYHFTGAINPGMSGGPAMTQSGEVFGINVARRLDANLIGFLVPGDRLSTLISRQRTTDASADALIEEARKGMLDGQERVAASILKGSQQSREIGHFRFPTQSESDYRCGGNKTSEENDGYALESASCMSSLFISAGRQQNVSGLYVEYSVVRNLSLDAFRFAYRLNALITADDDDKGDWKVVERYRCRTSTVKLAFGPARATLCTRTYKNLKELKDAHLRIVTLNSSDQALIGDLHVKGFTDANIRKLGRWFMETIEWKP